MVSFYLFVPFNSGSEVFFGCFLFPVLKDFGGWILQFLLLQTFILMGFDGSWSWIHPKLCSFFCVFGGFLLKSDSNLFFLTPQIFDNGRVLLGSRLQVKTSRADEGPCFCEALAGSALDAYLLSGGSCSSVATEKKLGERLNTPHTTFISGQI